MIYHMLSSRTLQYEDDEITLKFIRVNIENSNSKPLCIFSIWDIKRKYVQLKYSNLWALMKPLRNNDMTMDRFSYMLRNKYGVLFL